MSRGVRRGAWSCKHFPGDLEGEVWKPVPGAAHYEISNFGRVKSIGVLVKGSVYRRPVPFLLRPSFNVERDRLFVYISGQKKRSIHTLVCEAFNGPKPKGMICLHLNGDPMDNRPENLKWGTYKENSAHKLMHGTHLEGEQIATSKLLTAQIREIRVLSERGVRDVTIAKLFDIHKTTVQDILTGERWAHVK